MSAPTDPLDFTGRVVLVTGDPHGVGRGITERFLAAGADIAVCGEAEPDDLPTADGRSVVFFAADVRAPEQVDALVTSITDRWGRLDAVVNNAGGAALLDAATASPESSAAIIALDLLSTIHVSQRANSVMQAQDEGGTIVNITTVSALRPSVGTAISGAAKAGVIGLTQSIAVEWAPKVRVNCVSVGLLQTDHADPSAAATVPMGRLGEPTDVADACLFLSSPLASYITGANLVLHGGGEWPAFMAAVGQV